MPYAHFQIPCQGGDGEDALNSFLKRHRVLKVEKHFVAAGGDSFWAYQVQYEQTASVGGGGSGGAVSAAPSGPRKGMVDYKERLSEADFALFLQLKDWRKSRAETDGVEAYNVFTNAQLAEIAVQRCATLAALKQVPGVGEGRVEKYGAAVMDLLQKLAGTAAATA